MNRWLGSLTLTLAAAAAIAQAPFTIVRPADGSKVREKVKVLIPKNSVPEGGYVGIFLGDKFVEATVPTPVGKFYEYILDTKGRKIKDGPLKLEAVLYVDYKDQPRIVDRSSVNITVSNTASIRIPEDGLKLRYHFLPGTQYSYLLLNNVTFSSIAEDQNKLAGRPAELPLFEEKIRLLYAVDDAYGNGDGLVRMQALPTKGKDYALLLLPGDTEPKKYMDTDMAPLYMRLTTSGRQVWGSIPQYFPMSGSANPTSPLDLFANFPLPSLPPKAVKPGDHWFSNFQVGILNLAEQTNANNLVGTIPARGDFVDVEWEMGHPCAKITHKISMGNRSAEGKKLAALGSAFTDNKVSFDETLWFALDRRVVLKVVRDITFDQKSGLDGGTGVGSGAMPGNGPIGGSGDGSGDLGGGELAIGQGLRQMGTPGGKFGKGGGGAQGAGMGSLGGVGGAGGQRGGAPAGSQFQRIKFTQIFILEQ